MVVRGNPALVIALRMWQKAALWAKEEGKPLCLMGKPLSLCEVHVC